MGEVTPLNFLTLLYADAPQGWLTLGHKRDAGTRDDPQDPFRTVWCSAQDLEGATQQALALADEANVYFGVGLRRSKLSDGQRGSSADVGALPGLWADFDVKPGAFATKGEIATWLDTLPLKPTVTVDSGSGLHAYWLFKELWTFDADEQEYAAALEKGWQRFLKSRIGARHMDATHDLARVLRVPGTWNRKGKKATPVSVLWDEGPRYNPSDFDEWQDWSETGVREAPMDFVVRPGAQPPVEKFQLLARNDNLFTPAWNETAKNLKDHTPSGYAMRLANLAAQAGWTNQEICDLLVAFRERRPRENTKGRGWYAVTIAKARAAVPESNETVRRMEESDETDEKMACLSSLLGFRVLRLVKHRAMDPSGYLTPAWYVVETEAGRVDVPDAETLQSLSKMRAIIFDRLDRNIKVKVKEWPAVLDAMLAVMVTEDAPQESTEYEELRAMLYEYTRNKGTCDDPMRVHEGELLAKWEGEVWFSALKFGEWCRMVKRMHVGPRNLPKLLEAIGCRREKLDNVPGERGRRTSTVIWSLPPYVDKRRFV